MPLAIERFHDEAKRTLGLLDGVLATRLWVAGDTYSIADIAHFGWLWRRAFAGVDFIATPHVARWFATMSERPAVQRAIARAEALIPATALAAAVCLGQGTPRCMPHAPLERIANAIPNA